MNIDRDAARRFLMADYTVDAVRELLGPVAEAALRREEIVPAERATRGGSELDRGAGSHVPVPAAGVSRIDQPSAAGRRGRA